MKSKKIERFQSMCCELRLCFISINPRLIKRKKKNHVLFLDENYCNRWREWYFVLYFLDRIFASIGQMRGCTTCTWRILMYCYVKLIVFYYVKWSRALRRLNASIYKSKDLMFESMRLCHVMHSLKFSLFSFLFQQSLHLY